jgi:hypothetical protein
VPRFGKCVFGSVGLRLATIIGSNTRLNLPAPERLNVQEWRTLQGSKKGFHKLGPFLGRKGPSELLDVFQGRGHFVSPLSMATYQAEMFDL